MQVPDTEPIEAMHLLRISLVVLAVLCGGTRAAAFGLGVLSELKRTRLHWEGRHSTLLDDVSFISGVSGGSVLAAHYTAFGDETVETFERDFLAIDVQGRLLRAALAPQQLLRLGSPWYGRGQVLAEELELLFRGRSLGDAADRPGAPELVITATDLRHGAAFEFAPQPLGRMCIDWRQVPLSFAVAASAAVPLLLSPMTLHNHAGHCGPQTAAVPASHADFRSRLRAATEATYQDAQARPCVHLVDGGLADNLGLRGQPGSPFAADAQLHVIVVSLHDVPGAAGRRRLLQLPTSLALPLQDVRALQQAGASALRASPSFQRLLKSLDAAPIALADGVSTLTYSVPSTEVPGP